MNDSKTPGDTPDLSDADRRIMAAHAVSPEIIARCGAESTADGIAMWWAGCGQAVRVTRIADHLRAARRRKYDWPPGQTTFPAMIRESGAPRLLIAEGTMQHLAAASWAPEGTDVWGIWGIDGIHGKVTLPSLAGRDVWLCPDADSAVNPRVSAAVSRDAGYLRAAGAQSFHLVTLPPAAGEKTGLDDFLAAVPDSERTAAVAALMESSPAWLAALYTAVDWEEAWQAQPDDVDWLYRHWLEAGTINSLFAWQGTGKSLLAQEVSWSLACDGHSVVYVDEENRVTDWVERMKDIGAEPGDLAGLHLYSFASLPPLDTLAGGAHLLALAEAHGADLVVLDTTMRMVQGRENDSDTFLQLYRCALVPLKSRGVTVLRLDHPGKDASRGQRGTSAKGDAEDTVWMLTEAAPEVSYRLERSKSRSGHGPPGYTLTRQRNPLRHAWSLNELSAVNELAGQIADSGIPLEAGRPAVRAALAKAGIKVSNAQLSQAIRARRALSRTAADSPDSRATVADCPSTPHIGVDRRTAPVPVSSDTPSDPPPFVPSPYLAAPPAPVAAAGTCPCGLPVHIGVSCAVAARRQRDAG